MLTNESHFVLFHIFTSLDQSLFVQSRDTSFPQEGLIISTILVAKSETFSLFSLKRKKKYLHFLPADPFFRHSHLSIRSVAVSTFELASQSFLTTAPPLSKLKKRTSGKQNHSFYSWLSVFRPQRMLISWTLYIHPFNVSIFKSNCWRGVPVSRNSS